jgi:hypothetical protein
MRPKKLGGLSLKTLSSQVLEFEGKARANPIGAPFRCFLLRQAHSVRLDWKVNARYKHSSLFGLIVSNKGKKFYDIDTRVNIFSRHFLSRSHRCWDSNPWPWDEEAGILLLCYLCLLTSGNIMFCFHFLSLVETWGANLVKPFSAVKYGFL